MYTKVNPLLSNTVKKKLEIANMVFMKGTFIIFFENTLESLQSHSIHTMSHWSSWPICFPSRGTWVQSPGGYWCETGILLLALSRYIGDPDVIDHCGLVWGGLCPEPSLGLRVDYVMINLISHSSSVPVSHSLQAAASREPCGEPAILLHSHHVSLV